jgi:hypothetical protein
MHNEIGVQLFREIEKRLGLRLKFRVAEHDETEALLSRCHSTGEILHQGARIERFFFPSLL